MCICTDTASSISNDSNGLAVVHADRRIIVVVRHCKVVAG